jgi:hypothetical protein
MFLSCYFWEKSVAKLETVLCERALEQSDVLL